MSFSFFKPSRPKTPVEVAKAIKDTLTALDTKTVVEVKALEKALEEVEKNFATMRCMLSGDGENEPNADQVTQLAQEICKEDVISLLVHKLPILGWETRKDLVHCWSILLKQKVGSAYCCLQYIENHLELLDFLVVCYDSKEIALNCGNMLRDCIKFPSLAKYILESASFELFFKFVELPTFDVASDAFSTFKDLLTKHDTMVSEYLTAHYDEFFNLYENLLTSANYVTRRQSLKLLSDFLLEPPNSHIMKRYILEVRYLKVMMTLLKDSSKTIQMSAFHIFKVFVANPNKPREVKVILAKNHEKLLELLHNLSPGKGAEDEQFEEEKELIIKEIERVSRLPILERPIPIRCYSCEELQRATNNYDPSRIFHGDGISYWYNGSFEGRMISIKKYFGHDDNDFLFTDIAVSAKMSTHNNVLKLIGCCLETQIPISVYESAANGSLRGRVNVTSHDGAQQHQREPLSWQSRLKIAREIAHAISYLHTAFSRPIVHRSIKPGNVFLDQHGVAKLTEFSMSISIPEGETHVEDQVCGTIGFLCPHYIATQYITEKVDVYGFGSFLLELLTGQKLNVLLNTTDFFHVEDFENDRNFFTINEVVDPAILVGEEGSVVWQQLQAVLRLALICRKKDPEIRPDMVDVTKELRKIERFIL